MLYLIACFTGCIQRSSGVLAQRLRVRGKANGKKVHRTGFSKSVCCQVDI